MLYQQQEDVFTDQQQAVLHQVESRLASSFTRQKIAWLSGVDEESLARLLAGHAARQYGHRYDENTAAALQSLAEWLESEQKGGADDASYAITPTFTNLQNLYTQANAGGFFLAITGAWGIGKSEAARFYCANHPRTHNKPGAVRIQFGEADAKPAAALAKIAQHLNANGHAYRNGSMMDVVVSALRPGDQLLLEECQLLGEALNVVASIHDAVDISIVVQGNPDLGSMVWGNSAKFARFASRANRYNFSATTEEDVDAWLAWRGAGEGLTPGERKKLTETACAIACRPTQNGGLRALADVFRIAEKMYGTKADAGLLQALASQLKPDLTSKRGKS